MPCSGFRAGVLIEKFCLNKTEHFCIVSWDPIVPAEPGGRIAEEDMWGDVACANWGGNHRLGPEEKVGNLLAQIQNLTEMLNGTKAGADMGGKGWEGPSSLVSLACPLRLFTFL